MDDALRRNWLVGLTAIVAVLFGWIGLSASADALDRTLALAGAVLIIAALFAARRSRGAAGVLLVLGALPLAAVTWWSIVTPVLALLALLMGWLVIRTPRIPAADITLHHGSAATIG